MHRRGFLRIVPVFALLLVADATEPLAQQRRLPGHAPDASAGWVSAIKSSRDDEAALTAGGFGNPHISDVERWSDPRPPFPVVADPEPPVADTASEGVATQMVTEPLAEAARDSVTAVSPLNDVKQDQASQSAGRVPDVPTLAESPADKSMADEPVQPTAVAASPADEEPSQVLSTNEERELRVVSVSGWSSNVFPADPQAVTQVDLRILAMMETLSAKMRHLKFEREFTIFLMGLALLSGLLSGVGWFASRNRRMRALALRAGEGRAVVFRPAGGMLVPADEKMCSELCRTAHSLLTQIDSRVDDLQGIAPLRRVLQREMRHLEQFLAAVMAAVPAEAEEWRRMRNRLQRIVKELHRLQDIVEGARRSLSNAGFGSSEPPRDKHEAYEVLGVNADVDPKTLKKLVDALRACWHPDLAKDEPDRLTREERIKRINIAWDLITEKRQEA